MGLDSIVRDVVSVANDLTADLQDTITLEQWTGNATDGKRGSTYASGVSIKALVEMGPKPFRTSNGDTILAAAVVSILQPVTANGATGRQEPIDPRDRITLPNSEVAAPIMSAAGFMDPSTNSPYFYTVALGPRP